MLPLCGALRCISYIQECPATALLLTSLRNNTFPHTSVCLPGRLHQQCLYEPTFLHIITPTIPPTHPPPPPHTHPYPPPQLTRSPLKEKHMIDDVPRGVCGSNWVTPSVSTMSCSERCPLHGLGWRKVTMPLALYQGESYNPSSRAEW